VILAAQIKLIGWGERARLRRRRDVVVATLGGIRVTEAAGRERRRHTSNAAVKNDASAEHRPASLVRRAALSRMRRDYTRLNSVVRSSAMCICISVRLCDRRS
jgi:hypothetical protein